MAKEKSGGEGALNQDDIAAKAQDLTQGETGTKSTGADLPATPQTQPANPGQSTNQDPGKQETPVTEQPANVQAKPSEAPKQETPTQNQGALNQDPSAVVNQETIKPEDLAGKTLAKKEESPVKPVSEDDAAAKVEADLLKQYGPDFVRARKGEEVTTFSKTAWDLLGPNKEGWQKIVKVPPEVLELQAKQ